MRRLVSIVLGVVCIGFLIRAGARVDWGSVARAIEQASTPWLAFAIALVPVLLLLRTYRLAILVERSTRRVFRTQMVSSLFGSFTPANVGEASKVVLLHRLCGVAWPRAMTAFAVERLAEAVVLWVFALPLVVWLGNAGTPVIHLPRLSGDTLVGLLIVIGCLAALGGVFSARRTGRRWLRRAWQALTGDFPGWGPCIATFVVSGIVWGVEAELFNAILAALGEPAHLWLVAAILAAAILAGSMSGTPAGVGAFDLVVSGAFTALGYTASITVAALVLYRVISMLFPALIALGCIWNLEPADPMQNR